MSAEYKKFKAECTQEVELMAKNEQLRSLTLKWMNAANALKYSYHFEWLGRPIIQYPQDIVAMQEIIWEVKPDLIIETGIAHGGSLIFSASMLAMLDMFDAIESNTSFNPKQSQRLVLGIDIDIRAHNEKAIKDHPLASRIKIIQGSSIEQKIIDQVTQIAASYKTVLVCLDSNHTHEHVLAELEAYAPLTTKGSYCCVFDTVIEDMPKDMFPNRPWGPGNNPKTAVHEYVKNNNAFEIKNAIDQKIMITVAPNGYLKRIR
jgi:cephalosporin hydroxylase